MKRLDEGGKASVASLEALSLLLRRAFEASAAYVTREKCLVDTLVRSFLDCVHRCTHVDAQECVAELRLF